MNIYLAEKLMLGLMDQHGLIPEWSFEFDNAKRRYGCCHYGDKKLTLSKLLVSINDEESVRNVCLHEICHALYPNDGHGHRWQLKYIEIGGDGKRCFDEEEVDTPETKYIAICINGHVSKRQHKPKEVVHSCSQCSNRFDEKYLLNWILNSSYIEPVKGSMKRFFIKV